MRHVMPVHMFDCTKQLLHYLPTGIESEACDKNMYVRENLET